MSTYVCIYICMHTFTYLQVDKFLDMNVQTNVKACLLIVSSLPFYSFPIHLPRNRMKINCLTFAVHPVDFHLYKKPDLLSLVIGIDLETLL